MAYITPEGYRGLKAELDRLRLEERPRVVQEVAEAAAQGDRSENAEYIYGKKRLREIDRRVRYLNGRLGQCRVVDPSGKKEERVFFGAIVTVEAEDERELVYQLVGPDDPLDSFHISYQSPVGQALLGKSLGDEVQVNTPKGSRELVVIAVRYPQGRGLEPTPEQKK